jgi:DNA-binding winged helix-turn-helix (wHTH) protein/tetratricopeptide (TPR) repeat protein
MQEPVGFVFGPFRLDVRDERLWRGSDVLPLRHKTLGVLHALLARAGQLLTKEALLAEVWPETAVSVTVLTVAIRELRRVLGDQAQRPQFIETVHGRGYRFIAPVTVEEPSPERSQSAGTLHFLQPTAHGRPACFVGREDESAQLHQWWVQARQGRRQVGVIAGEPGIGKTALVNTFVAQVTAAEACWVGHGQCVEAYGAGEPYLPLLEALGRLGRGPEGARLVAVLRQYAPSWLGQLPALLPPAEWAALQRTAGPAAPLRMLRELTDTLDAFTAEAPLVLVVEDLHWSDRATLAWLASVARRPDPARLLLLGTYRPVEAMVQDPPLRAVLTELRQHGQCVELALGALSETAVTAYLAQRFGDTRRVAELVRVLHQRTRGNPLFLVALVDELVRQQVVTEAADGWAIRAGGDRITAIIPAHLRALIELQLARCCPEEQTLLAAASVAGVEFTTAAVAAAIERTDEAIEARCAAWAHQGQFLQAHGQAAWPDGTVTGCYGFRHALYPEVVYQQVPAGRRSRWHARMGTRLAQGLGEEAGDLAGAVAMHLLRGRLLSQAGAGAYGRAAFGEAVAYFEQALQALAHLPEDSDTKALAIELRLALGCALAALGENGWRLALLGEAETLARALDDRSQLGRVLASMSSVLRTMRDFDGAMAAGQQALALAVELGDRALQVQASLNLGQAYCAIGDFGRAAALLRRSVEAANRESGTPSTDVRIRSQAWLALILSALGAFAEGGRHGEEALRLATLEGRGQTPIITRAKRSTWPSSRRNAETRHSRCTSLASSMPTPVPPMSRRLQRTTSKPWPWPRNLACARSRPTATAALASSMPRWDNGSRPVPSCPPPASCTARWR